MNIFVRCYYIDIYEPAISGSFHSPQVLVFAALNLFLRVFDEYFCTLLLHKINTRVNYY